MFKLITPLFIANILNANCNILNKLKENNINIDAYKQALTFYNKNNFNKDYITFIDFSKPSTEKRMYIINNYTNEIETFKTSHGGGYNHKLNNINLKYCEFKGSRKNLTRPGFYKTIGFYSSIKGKRNKWKDIFKNFNGIKMIGMTKGVNDKILSKGVVIHSSKYVTKQNAGRSSGCFSVHFDDIIDVSNMIQNNNMIYAYVPQCKKDMNIILKQINGWENICN